MGKKIVITGGGTGGHLSVAKAVAIELKKLGQEMVFIGSNSGQDRAWFEGSRLFSSCYFLDSSGVVDKKGVSKISSLFNIVRLSISAARIIKNEGVKAVFSVGGFSSAPASIASIYLKKPLYIHEQNSIKGSLNRILEPFSKELFSSYDKRSKLKNYPVRKEFFDSYRFRSEIGTVGFFGGSQGAKFINDLAISMIKELYDRGIGIVHQCGKNEEERVRRAYEELEIDAKVYGFYDKPWELFSEVDFAISRAGAGMLWELTASGVPALFVPYPYAAGNHQFFNAKFLLDSGACYLLKQEDVTKERVLRLIDGGIKRLSENLRGKINYGGAEEIARFITGL